MKSWGVITTRLSTEMQRDTF